MREGTIHVNARDDSGVPYGVEGKVQYPDEWCFVFNPNYVIVEFDSVRVNKELELRIAMSGRTYNVRCNAYQGKAKIYISKILQVMFDDVVNSRSEQVDMALWCDGNGVDMSFIAIWGGLQIGEQFGKYGAFRFNGRDSNHIRNIVWFRKFPFKVSMYKTESDNDLSAFCDGASVPFEQEVPNGIFELTPSDTFPNAVIKAQYNICINRIDSGFFDETFNFRFGDLSKMIIETVNLKVCDDTEGLYLRWIDRFGFFQYYLFVGGESSVKSKMTSDTVYVERNINGIYFGGLDRPLRVTSTKTTKCSAMNLRQDVLEYVQTVVSSSIIDLYMGKSVDGTEIWQPVKVVDGTYKTDPKTKLSDYEITVQFPDFANQSF